MKKPICVIMCIFILLSLSGCADNIKDTKTREVPSEIYSQQAIDSAVKTIKTEFVFSWRNCTLIEIYYAGDEITAECQQWAERYDADEAIVLCSSFKVNKADGAQTLNEGATYKWNWILVRTDGGKWKHVDHGFM